MKVLIVGLGAQGQKRKKLLNKKFVFATVDIKNKSADFKKIEEAPLENYDSVFICTPDSAKLKILNFCIKNKKKRSYWKAISCKFREQNKEIRKQS